MIAQIIKLSDGNPGAFTCLLGIIKNPENAVAGITIIPKIEELNIIGTDLYVLWSDISNKDYYLMAHICKNAPDELIKFACSKQDYSGRNDLKEFILSYNNKKL
jgi:hypothetical protein